MNSAWVKQISDSIASEHALPRMLDDLPRITYHEDNMLMMGQHAGQRKLLLGELNFYSQFYRPGCIVVYAGSAPSEHAPIILQQFPDMQHIYVDPNYHSFDADFTYIYQRSSSISNTNFATFQRNLKPHSLHYKISRPLLDAQMLWGTRENVIASRELQSNPGLNKFLNSKDLLARIDAAPAKIHIIQDYLTRDLAQRLARELRDRDVIFISDIRSTQGKHPTDLDYMWNDALQMYAVREINPRAAMLKFHPPYFSPNDQSVVQTQAAKREPFYSDIAALEAYGIKAFRNYASERYEYLAGTVELQAWGPSRSSESRLVCTRESGFKVRNYDHTDWDNAFMWHKSIRGYAYYSAWRAFTSKELSAMHRRTSHGWCAHVYDGCYDCAREIDILQRTVRGKTLDAPTRGAIIELKNKIDDVQLYATTQKQPVHGYVQSPPTLPRYIKIVGHSIEEYTSNAYRTMQIIDIMRENYKLAQNWPQLSVENRRKLINIIKKYIK